MFFSGILPAGSTFPVFHLILQSFNLKKGINSVIKRRKIMKKISKKLFHISPYLFNRIQFWGIWRKEYQCYIIISSNFIQLFFTVKRRIIHNNNCIFGKSRQKNFFKPFLKKLTSHCSTVLHWCNYLFSVFCSNNICTFKFSSLYFAINLLTSF